MTRKKKLILNTSFSLSYQLITLVCGFILPRFFLTYYGSEVNGLVSSITQFLGFISLAECGVGAVVQSALYKPLAEKNEEDVSKIIVSAERFFHKIAIILLLYTTILMAVYPLITIHSFSYFFTASLILVISISSFAQYYFSMTYRILLSADQVAFIQLGLQGGVLIVNTMLSIILMKNGASIQVVKLISSLLFLLQPLGLTIYVKKHYNINRKIMITEEPIKQKWNGLAQHIATVVLGNTDTVVLTLFSTLQNVSVYAVYHLVVDGVKKILMSTTTGMQAMLGNMYAKNESETLNKTFSFLEWLLHTLTVFSFACTGILIVPFICVYTRSVNDANYIVPIFAVIITMAQASYCLRLPYNMMVLAAGHYKQTQMSAIIEMAINIIISVALVKKYGLIGVGGGTFIAMLYRTIFLALYLKGNILNRPFRYFLKHLLVDCFSVFAIVASTISISILPTNYFEWVKYAFFIAAIAFAEIFIINVIFYPKELNTLKQQLLSRIRK